MNDLLGIECFCSSENNGAIKINVIANSRTVTVIRFYPHLRFIFLATLEVMEKTAGPYTPIVRSGDWIIVSGQVGHLDGVIVEGGLEPELRQLFVNLKRLLASENATLDNVLKTTVFLTDINDYDQMNEIYMEEFGRHRPARSAVAVASLPLGAMIEIEAWAKI